MHSIDNMKMPEANTTMPDFTAEIGNYTNDTSERLDYMDYFMFPSEIQTAGYCISYVLFVLIVVLNSVVLVVLRRNRKDRKRLHFFIFYLALADLLVGLIYVLGEAIERTVDTWLAGEVMCKIYNYLKYVVMCASNNILIGMSVDRFLAVAAPMRFVKSGTKLDRLLVAMAWILSLLVCAVFPIFIKELSFKDIKFCDFNMSVEFMQAYLTIVFLYVYVIPLFAIIICYSGISIVVWKKWRDGLNLAVRNTNDEDALMTNSEALNLSLEILQCVGVNTCSIKAKLTKKSCKGGKKETTYRPEKSIQSGLLPKAKIKTIKMTVIICLAFIICWTPFFFFNLLDVYKLIEPSMSTRTLMQTLCPLNSAANPLIFILFNHKLFKKKPRRTAYGESTAFGMTLTTMLPDKRESSAFFKRGSRDSSVFLNSMHSINRDLSAHSLNSNTCLASSNRLRP